MQTVKPRLLSEDFDSRCKVGLKLQSSVYQKWNEKTIKKPQNQKYRYRCDNCINSAMIQNNILFIFNNFKENMGISYSVSDIYK